jgi:hypothetical protein
MEALQPAVCTRGTWSHRIADFIALAIGACALMEFCSAVLGIQDNLCVIVLALACASDPVLRLLEARRHDGDPQARRGTEVTAIVAAAPWIVIGWLHNAYPFWFVWQAVPVPLALRYAGCALAFGVVLVRPLMEHQTSTRDEELYVPAITLPSQLLMVSFLLVSFSVTTAALTIYWLAAAGAQRAIARWNGADAAVGRDLLVYGE